MKNQPEPHFANQLLGVLRLIAGAFLQIRKDLDKIMATQAEEAAALTAIGDNLDKGIADVIAALNAAGATTAEVDAATARLKAAGDALDAVTP